MDRTRESLDERNSAFDPEPAAEEHRPGMGSSERAEGVEAEGHHHRLMPRDSKDVPQGPLAKRIRKARGG
jgi:hypothetical protein